METVYYAVEVDTNDGDYETHLTDVTDVSTKEVEDFFKSLGRLHKTENYYYDFEGKKVVTGNKVRFRDNVGHSTYNEECGLKSLVLGEGEFISEGWTTEEVYEEGMILQKDYDNLVKFLPMYEEGGFHSIISVTKERHTEAEVLKEYKL